MMDILPADPIFLGGSVFMHNLEVKIFVWTNIAAERHICGIAAHSVDQQTLVGVFT